MVSIPVTRAPQRFRVWESRIKHMHYPYSDKHAHSFGFIGTGITTSFLHQPEGGLCYTDGHHISSPSILPSEQLVPLQDTGLATKDGRPIYEADIISFTIKGATHGREPNDCAAAHVWWCTEDACWAFGRWVQTHQYRDNPPHTYTWWYTAADDGFDHSSLTVLGNLFESPELVASLGYAPSL